MKIKEIFFIILGALLVAACTWILLLEKESSVKKLEQKNSFEISEKKILDNSKPFKIDVAYPEIAGADALNKKISDLINSQISDFKANSLENDNAVKQVDPEAYAKYPREYDLNINYTKGEIDENVVSFIFEVYSFTGGAHGSTNFFPINYDLKNNTEIKLSDLFKNNLDYIKTISDYCIKDLTAQMTKSGAIDMTDTNWMNRGAGPDAENFQIFLINKDNIVFFFPQYQVAAYAAGNFEVIYPRP